MKNIFNNSQLAHTWANQTQESGTNSSGSMYFSGTTLYSYGSHHVIGKIHTNKKGQRYAVFNSDHYSNSTAKQSNHAFHAVLGLMPYLSSSDPLDPIKGLLEKEDSIIDRIFNEFRSIKTHDKYVDFVKDDIVSFNETCDLLAMSKRKLEFTEDLTWLYREHFLLREKRKAELNTPEQLEKKEKQRLRKEQLKADRLKMSLAEKIQEFRDFKIGSDYNIKPQVIRIKNDELQTSGGASVPVADARRLLMALENGVNITGKTIGDFTINWVNEDSIKIGCHTMEIQEIKNVLNGDLK